jgi:hypothetical protein
VSREGWHAWQNGPDFPASDKRGDKRETIGAPSVASVGACERRAMDTESISPGIWHLSFKAASPGDPPPALRVRALLKRALRSFGLRCVDYSTSAGPASDGRPLPFERRGVAAGGPGGATKTFTRQCRKDGEL